MIKAKTMFLVNLTITPFGAMLTGWDIGHGDYGWAFFMLICTYLNYSSMKFWHARMLEARKRENGRRS